MEMQTETIRKMKLSANVQKAFEFMIILTVPISYYEHYLNKHLNEQLRWLVLCLFFFVTLFNLIWLMEIKTLLEKQLSWIVVHNTLKLALLCPIMVLIFGIGIPVLSGVTFLKLEPFVLTVFLISFQSAYYGLKLLLPCKIQTEIPEASILYSLVCKFAAGKTKKKGN